MKQSTEQQPLPQSGAVVFLFKPFDEEPLLDAIGRALALSTTGRSDA